MQMVIEGDVSDKGGRIKEVSSVQLGEGLLGPQKEASGERRVWLKLGIEVAVCAPGPPPDWTHCQLDGHVST